MSEPASDAEVAAFEAWLGVDPAHARAYRDADRIATLGERLPHRLLATAPSRFWALPLQPAFGVAAAVALLGAGAVWLVSGGSPVARAAVSNPGPAIRVVRLRDDTIVILDAQAKIDVATATGARNVSLESGRARFIVTRKDVAPFAVLIAGAAIEARSATFDVASLSGVVTVSVLAGSVEIGTPEDRPASENITLQARQAASITLEHKVRSVTADTDLRWPDSRLRFERVPLATIVARANRRGKPPIRIADDATGRRPVTGILDIRDTRSLARKLAVALDLVVIESPNDILLRR